MINKISSYEILTKIFVLSQNPEVRFISREFYEISALNPVRASFLIKKFGKDHVFKIINNENPEFLLYPNLFKKQELVIWLLKKGADTDSVSFQSLFEIMIMRDWIEAIDYILNIFDEITEERFEFHTWKGFYPHKYSEPRQKDTRYFVPKLFLLGVGRSIVGRAVERGKASVYKQLFNAHKIIPKLEIDYSKAEILYHPKISKDGLPDEFTRRIFQSYGIDILKVLNDNDPDNSIISGASKSTKPSKNSFYKTCCLIC
ncbi:hypothetical protein BB559_005978 [Furculomyces boomerangus]|uniref:Uncharacterized protein n=2 Tax=Harpellales TaxID=61421 RepID=A0A2T9Y5G2_9FUNG|nr:hypothetical protein BB559_005978 [Furculomyces boomerangus]PVZ96873.1 hypothetical protein BB558_007188 [Smittium angustum]